MPSSLQVFIFYFLCFSYRWTPEEKSGNSIKQVFGTVHNSRLVPMNPASSIHFTSRIIAHKKKQVLSLSLSRFLPLKKLSNVVVTLVFRSSFFRIWQFEYPIVWMFVPFSQLGLRNCLLLRIWGNSRLEDFRSPLLRNPNRNLDFRNPGVFCFSHFLKFLCQTNP